MALKIWNITTKEDRGEDKKPNWPPVGTVFYNEEDDRMNIKLNMFPNQTFYCFPKDQTKKQPF